MNQLDEIIMAPSQAFVSNISADTLKYFTAISDDKYILMPITSHGDNFQSSVSLCDNCRRYLFRFFNSPYVVSCGHTFCEICICTENEIFCKPCNKTINVQNQKNHVIENKSLNNLYEKYTEDFGEELEVDILYRKLRRQFTEKVRGVFAYLPIWNTHFKKGKCLQMTSGFWMEEKKLAKERIEKLSNPILVLYESSILAKVMAEAKKAFDYQTNVWTSVLDDHKNGLQNIPKTLCGRSLDLTPILNKFDNVYLSTNVNGERFFLKLSKGFEIIHLHSGFWGSSVESDFVENNKIFETSAPLNKMDKVFLDITFTVPEGTEKGGKAGPHFTKHTRRVYIAVEKEKTNYAERIFSLFTGQSKSLKGSDIKRGNSTLIISVPNELFSIPSEDINQTSNINKLDSAYVVGYKASEGVKLAFVFGQSNNKLVKDSLQFYFGNVESGLNFLASTGLSSKTGIINDCGVVLPWKSL